MATEDVKAADEAVTPEADDEAAKAANTSDAAPADDDEETEDAEEPAGDGDEGEDEPRPKRKRPGRLERRIVRQEQENAALRRMLEERAAPRQETPKPAVRPKLDDFDTLEDFTEAMSDWKADQKIAAVRQEGARKANETARQTEERKKAERLQAWVAAGEKAVEGFSEYIADEDVKVTPIMAEALTEAENGHAAALYLVDHPEEAARIAGLTTAGQAMAIARLAAKAVLPGKKRSQTPPPVKTLSGASKATSDPSKMTTEEYYEYRTKQMRARS